MNEQRIDNIFLLEDGSYAIIDYENKYSEVNKLKYIGYILRVLHKLQQDGIDIMTDPEQQMFALAGLLSFSDKVIDDEVAEEIRSIPVK